MMKLQKLQTFGIVYVKNLVVNINELSKAINVNTFDHAMIKTLLVGLQLSNTSKINVKKKLMCRKQIFVVNFCNALKVFLNK